MSRTDPSWNRGEPMETRTVTFTNPDGTVAFTAQLPWVEGETLTHITLPGGVLDLRDGTFIPTAGGQS